MKTPARKRSVDIAVALAYDERTGAAPVIVGVGGGETARSLTRFARRYGIPLAENAALANSLAELPENSEIPASHYSEVADLLSEIENELLLERLRRS